MSDQEKKAGFVVGQLVQLIDLDLPGRVLAVSVDTQGLMLKVGYWWNGDRKEAWVFSTELR